MSQDPSAPQSEQLVFQTVDLPHCWVCGVRFASSIPPGPAMREDHHVIPQAFGGADGPTVSICASHHNALHNIEHRLIARKPYDDLTAGVRGESLRRLMWLATRAAIARNASKDDPNRRTKLMLPLDSEARRMIEWMKGQQPLLEGFEGGLTSQTKVILYALRLAAAVHSSRRKK